WRAAATLAVFGQADQNPNSAFRPNASFQHWFSFFSGPKFISARAGAVDTSAPNAHAAAAQMTSLFIGSPPLVSCGCTTLLPGRMRAAESVGNHQTVRTEHLPIEPQCVRDGERAPIFIERTRKTQQ